MAFGFQSFNDNNIQQIDSSYSNYYMIASGTASTSSSGGISNFPTYNNNYAKKVTINFSNSTGVTPLIFIKSNETNYANGREFVFFSVEIVSASSFNILAMRAYDSTGDLSGIPYISTSFSWRAYLPQSVLSQEAVNIGSGLNVYRDDGAPVYSSNINSVMKIYDVKDVYGSWNVFYGPPNYGLFFEITSCGPSNGSENPWFLANQSAFTQIYIKTEESGYETFGVWLGGRSINGTDYLCGFTQVTARVQSGMQPVLDYASTTPDSTQFYDSLIYVSNSNSGTGVLTISTFERINSGPLNTNTWPTGCEFLVINYGTAPTMYMWGPYVSQNSTNGGNDSTMTLQIPTGQSVPSGITINLVRTNKIASNNASGGVVLVRVPGVLVLKS